MLYAVKMLLTLKNREMFRKINSYQYIYIKIEALIKILPKADLT